MVVLDALRDSTIAARSGSCLPSESTRSVGRLDMGRNSSEVSCALWKNFRRFDGGSMGAAFERVKVLRSAFLRRMSDEEEKQRWVLYAD